MIINKKNIWLIVSILCFCFLCYQLAFKKTFEILSLKRKLNSELNTSFDLLKNYPSLVIFNKKLDIQLNKNNFSSNQSLGNNLFEKLTEYTKKNRVKILNFNEPHTYNSNNAITYTYEIILQGNFKDILKSINELEKTNLGSIVSQCYVKEKNHRTGKYFLNNKILIQIIK